jgi:hypothetical protein
MKRSILNMCIAVLMLTVTAECKHHDVPPPLPSQFPKQGEEIAAFFDRSFKVDSDTSVCSMSGSGHINQDGSVYTSSSGTCSPSFKEYYIVIANGMEYTLLEGDRDSHYLANEKSQPVHMRIDVNEKGYAKSKVYIRIANFLGINGLNNKMRFRLDEWKVIGESAEIAMITQICDAETVKIDQKVSEMEHMSLDEFSAYHESKRQECVTHRYGVKP